MIAAHAAGIRVFATGGIGGVHRGALGGTAPTFDVSSDLEELARTPVAVVCAGPKAILDVPATIEYLETRGVPVIALGSADVPGFYSRLERGAGAAVGRVDRRGRRDRRRPPRARPRVGHPALRPAAGRVGVAGRRRTRRRGACHPGGRRRRHPRSRDDAVAARPRRRDHGRRLGPRERRADRQQRASRGGPRRRAGRGGSARVARVSRRASTPRRANGRPP